MSAQTLRAAQAVRAMTTTSARALRKPAIVGLARRLLGTAEMRPHGLSLHQLVAVRFTPTAPCPIRSACAKQRLASELSGE